MVLVSYAIIILSVSSLSFPFSINLSRRFRPFDTPQFLSYTTLSSFSSANDVEPPRRRLRASTTFLRTQPREKAFLFGRFRFVIQADILKTLFSGRRLTFESAVADCGTGNAWDLDGIKTLAAPVVEAAAGIV